MSEVIALEVVEITSGASVHRVMLQPGNRSDPAVERIMCGLMRNMDLDRYFVREISA